MKVRLAATLLCLCGPVLAEPAHSAEVPSGSALALAGLTLMAGIALRRLGRQRDHLT